MTIKYGEFLGKWVFECHDLRGWTPDNVLWSLNPNGVIGIDLEITDKNDPRTHFLAYSYGEDDGILLQASNGAWARIVSRIEQSYHSNWVETLDDNYVSVFKKFNDPDHPGEYRFGEGYEVLMGGFFDFYDTKNPQNRSNMTIIQHDLADGVAKIRSQGYCHNRDFSPVAPNAVVDLTGADLHGIDFSGADFSSAILTDVNFTDACLKEVNFDDTDLTTASFSNQPQLSKTADKPNSFRGTKLKFSQIKNSLKKANFDMKHAVFDDLPDLDLTGLNAAGATLNEINLGGCTLDNANFAKCELGGAHFEQSSLKGADFSRSGLVKAHFMEADLSNAKLPGAVFSNPDHTATAILTKSILDGADFSNATLTDVPMDRVIARGSDTTFRDAIGTGINCDHSFFHRVCFDGAKLEGSSFTDACVIDSSFRGCDFGKTTGGRRTDLSSACLQGADFTGAKLNAASFIDANLQLEPGSFPVTLPDGPQSVPYKATIMQEAGTNGDTTCPDGRDGPCGQDSWAAKNPPKDWTY